MGLFDDFFGKQASTPNQFTDTGAANSKNDTSAGIYDTGESGNQFDNSEAKNTPIGNWYKQKPYSFEFGDAGKTRSFYLPISPSNLSITTHFATNIISTMYGTVEEHSEQRYFDINIAGTTGMSPRYYKEISDQVSDSNDTKALGRAGVPIKSKIGGGLSGFFKRTASLVENTLNQVSDLLGEDKATTGIDLRRTGYVAFHNFYKFLLVHKKLVAREKMADGYTARDKKLKFINYKDNNMYDVAIQTFQLTRDASNPMLYNYNIVMRAYNLRSADAKDMKLDVGARADELGLSGLNTSSAFSILANKARKAKNAAYSAIATAKGFGS